MSLRTRLPVTLVLLGAGVLGCAQPEPEPEPQPLPTTPAIHAELAKLLATADEDLPGAAVASLRRFRDRYGDYDILAEVAREIERWTAAAAGRYSQARELGRQGDFARAEVILDDLATHLPETVDGQSAAEHLAFDFHLHRAQWLMVRQRWDESERVARPLLDRDLTRTQVEQVEQILDGVSQVDAAMSQAVAMQTRAACRQLMILLETIYVEQGSYPVTLSLSDVESWDPIGGRSILRSLAAIESYRAHDQGYSFVAVGAGGQARVAVVDGVIEG